MGFVQSYRFIEKAEKRPQRFGAQGGYGFDVGGMAFFHLAQQS